MASAIIKLTIIFCATTSFAAAPTSDWPPLWRHVAESYIIATGTLHAPIEEIKFAVASGKRKCVNLQLTLTESFKGEAPPELNISWNTGTGGFLDSNSVVEMDGKEVLVFLDTVDESRKELHFANYIPEALSLADDPRTDAVRRECQKQAQQLAKFDTNFQPAKVALYKEVKALINSTTKKRKQMQAFEKLEQLGADAVPAIVMLMDDRRDLPVQGISLRNKSANAFEAYRHYCPDKVVDALAAILNQITGDSFADIVSGGSERERQKAVNGWRIYLYHLQG